MKDVALMNSCVDCLDKSCATAVLSGNEMGLIEKNRHISSVRRRTTLINEGSPASNIIYLRSGLVKESILRPDNQEQILQIIQPQSYLGLASVFGDRINHYSYTALTDLKVCYIDIEVFTKLIKGNGKFAFEILTSIGKDNLSNFHRFINQSHKKIYGRVADILLYFSSVVFKSDNFQIPLTRKEIADMVGTSRESTGRVLTRFAEDNLIEIQGKVIRIIDVKKLERISRFG